MVVPAGLYFRAGFFKLFSGFLVQLLGVFDEASDDVLVALAGEHLAGLKLRCEFGADLYRRNHSIL